jgi:putative oxidoreductase
MLKLFNNLDCCRPYMLGVLRLVAALLFMEHGTAKLLGFPHVAMFDHLQAFSLVWFAGVLELVGGGLLALGLFTRATAFVLSGEMAVAYFMMHSPKGFFPVLNQGELAALYAFLFLYLVFAGGGAWSLDALMARKGK